MRPTEEHAVNGIDKTHVQPLNHHSCLLTMLHDLYVKNHRPNFEHRARSALRISSLRSAISPVCELDVGRQEYSISLAPYRVTYSQKGVKDTGAA